MPGEWEKQSKIETKETVVDQAEQWAINTIKDFKDSEKVQKAIDKKFPEPDKTNKSLENKKSPDKPIDKTDNKPTDKKDNMPWVDLLAKIDQKTLENIRLTNESDKIVDDLVQKDFKSVVAFMSYFTQAKTWFSMKIINSPALSQNGRDNLSLSSISDTNPFQKKEIAKAFMTIPASVLQNQINEFNQNWDRKLYSITPENFEWLLNSSKSYQDKQQQIIQNNIQLKQDGQDLQKSRMWSVDLADYKDTQIIGKLFELPPAEQEKINNSLDNIKNTYDNNYTITSIKLIGYADATPVTPNWKKIIEESFTKHLNLLKSKWVDTSDLPVDYNNLGTWLAEKWKIDAKDISNTDIVSNRGFAITRAIMQISQIDAQHIDQLKKSKLDLDIHTSDKKWDKETEWWVVFSGIWSIKGESKPPTEFQISNKSPEILLETWLKVAVKIWDQIKMFEFEKQDVTSPDGKTTTTKTFAKMVDEGHYWSHGNEKTTLDGMKWNTHYDQADVWWPVFYINIPDSNQADENSKYTVEKINNSNLKNPDNIPSATDLLNLYNTLGWAQSQQAEKFKNLYSL